MALENRSFEDIPQCATEPAPGASHRNLYLFTFSLLVVEFLDELLFGVREAAWPLIRTDLRLSYFEVGVLLSVPGLLANFIEPFFGILADVWRRRAIILGGGVLFALATLLIGLSYDFTFLLLALILVNPASGAFVGLSQAALMDAAPERHEQNMARWSFAGSLANSTGPVCVWVAVATGANWRWLFAWVAALCLPVILVLRRFPLPTPAGDEARCAREALREGLRGALEALRRREVLRWLTLLQFIDFTWDIFRGFIALYFVDVVGATEAQAALAVIVWTCLGLPGDFLLIPLLERVRGLSYLRVSACLVLLLFPSFLLADDFSLKLVLLGLLGFVNAGWYSILKARLYSEMRGRSGTVMTLDCLFGILQGLIPLALGAFAQRYGLAAMMWLLIAGPLGLLAGLAGVRDRD